MTRPAPGVTEAAVESGTAVLIPRVGEWPGAEGLRARLNEHLDQPLAELAWDFYRTASFISCPVRTAGGRTFGVLAISSNPPLRALDAEDLRTIEVFARLAALALERSELLEREAGLRREEGLVNRALQAVAASIDLEDVYAAIVDQAAELSGATQVLLTRYDPGGAELRGVAASGVSAAPDARPLQARRGHDRARRRFGRAVRLETDDSDRFVRWVVETQGVSSFMHVPITLGGRLFGVLSAIHEVPGRFGDADLQRLASLGVGAAGAISHALEFEHERRIARSLTRGYCRARPTRRPGSSSGSSTSRSRTRSAAATSSASGPSRAARWRCSWATSAARASRSPRRARWCASSSRRAPGTPSTRPRCSRRPTASCACASARRLRHRLPRDRLRGPAALLQRGPPAAVPAARRRGSEALEGRGLPLGVEEDGRHEEREVEIGLGDVLFAATDGLLEVRRDRAFFGDARLPELLVRARAHDAAAGVRRARLRRGAGVGARAPRRRRRARAAARAGARAARRARLRPGRAGALRRVSGAGARAARARASCPRRRSSPPTACSRRSARRSSCCTRAAGPSAAAGCARWGRSWPRSSACSSPPDARLKGHGRLLLEELERRAAAAGATAGAAAHHGGADRGAARSTSRRATPWSGRTRSRAAATCGSSAAWGEGPPRVRLPPPRKACLPP